jgi:hypothetical protein
MVIESSSPTRVFYTECDPDFERRKNATTAQASTFTNVIINESSADPQKHYDHAFSCNGFDKDNHHNHE